MDHQNAGRGGLWGAATQLAGGTLAHRAGGLRGSVGGRWCCDCGPQLAGRGVAGQEGVEGPHQPVERCVVDQVVQDVVQRALHLAQSSLAAGQRALRQGSGAGRRNTGVDVGGGATKGARLPLEVAGQALQTRRQCEAGGLQLLGEGGGQGVGFSGLLGRVERRTWLTRMLCHLWL